MSQLHCMAGFGGEGGAELEPELGLASEGSDSSHDQLTSPGSPHNDRKRLHKDVEMGSSGSGTESHSNESHGNESVGSSNDNSSSAKDSALMESSGSNKSPSPPRSSNAFSRVSSEQDNPSSSGCSSEQSAKAKTQKELFKTLKELKMHPPSDKRSKASTLNTLKYALRCVKQVKANEEYYQMLMTNDSQPPGLDVFSYTIEEINRITSEYTNKNTDIFAMAVSLITGKIVYISDQAATILHCQREQFTNAKFVEFLTPQDVSVFYSFTTPYHLPSWSMCTGTESSPTEGMQEKSFFCRISGGKGRGGDLQYFPFRMTPYLMKVQDAELAEEQSCCLLLAERVQSGYDAPRIPSDKRIFTTTHTPSCVFQDIDERAVPLLGYLPQDLIGTPVLLHLHPSDRPLMLAVHHKILQYMGQPFDHSVRFCARNGEYVTIDTSWSSFVNPWSRKVSFVIGRHKVRMGPVNEDVFAVPAATEGKLMDSDIQQITEQIHRLLLQPVHNMGSSGYRSHGSNGSHEQLLSVGSPSETNRNGDALENRNGVEEPGKSKPRTFQEICKGVHMLKSQDQQVYLPSSSHFPSSSPSFSEPESRKTTDRAQHLKSPVLFLKDLVVPPLLVNDSTAAASVEEVTCSDQAVYSYQQISCLDSVIKYLESCITPVTVKRKYQFSSNTTSSISDEDIKDSETAMQVSQDPGLSIKAPKKPPSGAVPVVGGPLAPLALPSKAESVVSITSQCSYSSTIVHVGDKKPQPESEIIEDVAESPAPPALPVSVVSPPTQEKEAYKRLGLTKQVLAAHTHKEEQAFLTRCKELRNARTFQKDCSTYLHRQRGLTNMQEAAGTGGVFEQRAARPEASPAAAKKGSRNKKSKKPRMKYPDSSDSAVSHRKPRLPLQGLNQTSWSPSEASQSQAFSVPYPAVVPCYPLSGYSAAPTAPAQITCPDPSDSTGFGKGQSSQPLPTATPYPAPIVTPLVALVVPNYLFPQVGQMGQIDQMGQIGEMAQMGHIPQMGQVPQLGQISQLGQMAVAPRPSFFPEQPPCQPQPAYTSQHRSPGIPTQTTFNPQQAFQAPQMAYTTQQPFQTQIAYSTQLPFQAQTAYNTQQAFPSQPSFPVQAQFVPQASYPSQAFPFGLSSEPPKALAMETGEGAVSHCSTPSSTAREPTRSPPLFESRCSSPLQLNLLQLEDIRSVVGQDSMAPSSGAPRSRTSAEKSLTAQPEEDLQQVASSPDCAHSDGHSSSCDLLDVLLHDETDSSSVSGSGSGSGWRSVSRSGSGSNGRGTSSEASGSRNGSNDTCKYFGSVDSLENEPKAKAKVKAKARERVETESEAGQSQVHSQGQGEGEHFIEYVLQEPLCLLMANADENIMMTYQMPSRDIQKVLREDQQRLRLMQKSQPHFSSVQQRELVKEQPWVRRGGLPKAINVKECLYCEDSALTPIEEDLSNMEEPTTRREESSTSHPDPAPPPGQRSPPPPLDTFTKLLIPVTNKQAAVKKMTVKNVKTPWIDEEF